MKAALPESRQPPLHTPSGARNTLLAITTALLVLGALKLSAVMTFPLLFAFFLLFFLWPLQRRLEGLMPGPVAFGVVLAGTLVTVIAIGASLYYSAWLITDRLPEYADRLETLYERLNQSARALGLSPYEEIKDIEAVTEQITGLAAGLLTGFLTTGGFLGLILVYLVLGLTDMPRVRQRLRRGFGAEKANRIRTITGKISDRLHRFMLVRTATSVATGLLTAVACWAVGLDLAFVWGVIALFLNFIPTLGSAIAVIPPTLMAIVQFGEIWAALGVLLMLTVIQMGIGNYVEPILQGRLIAISPLVAFFSLLFWGWIGGVPGAILGVPITIGLIIVAEEFQATWWLAHLLADIEEHGNEREGR